MAIVLGTSRGLYVDGALVALDGVEITALTFDRTDLYVGTDDGKVLRGDGQGVWNEIGRTEGGRVNCLMCSGSTLWVGTTRSRLMRDNGGGLEEVSDFQDVEGRADWFTPWGGRPDVRSLADDGRGSIFVNVHVGGIPRTNDGGRSWSPTIDIETDVHQVICSEGILLAATAYGLYSSGDEGRSWSCSDEGLHATYCRAVAVADGHVLLSASTGPDGSHSALYRKQLGASAFEHCRNGVPEFFDDNIDSHTIAALGTRVAVGGPDGHLYVSEDVGGSWATLGAGFPPISAVVLTGN